MKYENGEEKEEEEAVQKNNHTKQNRNKNFN